MLTFFLLGLSNVLIGKLLYQLLRADIGMMPGGPIAVEVLTDYAEDLVIFQARRDYALWVKLWDLLPVNVQQYLSWLDPDGHSYSFIDPDGEGDPIKW